ncbi:Phosphonoacetate hydrolase [Polyplosphaeria fusca]|uniref:Phosphonoacetate hydrolase n=1 Tax=Polyplosphaeria fusca TaxID=682080 RepID=A0A9P4V7E0_9PLEO|nr:Phosphonoacetate hydrolase [Polyplosphaeria fusca]
MSTTTTTPTPITLHTRTYPLPTHPTIIICIDGFDPTYLTHGLATHILPTLQSFVDHGFHATATCSMPSVTNANNLSIITGAPTRVHGVAGNYYLDRATGEEVMIVDDALVRGSTILAEMARRGVRVAAVTAKDKLRRILSRGLDREKNICFSSQCADEETVGWLGWRERPSQYSGELSLFVLDAGVKMLEEGRAELVYLTLSDYVQHKYAPGTEEADGFMAAVDERVKKMVELGAVVAITGDHGMSDKCGPDGKPNVLFVQDELEKKFGGGCARVICPITDPFVKHHGALGSFVRVHVNEGHAHEVKDMCEFLRGGTFPQVEIVMERDEACEKMEMPPDREGDFVVISIQNAVLGSKAEEHDLSTLEGHRLRSHGGFSEQNIPLLMSTPAKMEGEPINKRWRNFDIFDLVLNHGQ